MLFEAGGLELESPHYCPTAQHTWEYSYNSASTLDPPCTQASCIAGLCRSHTAGWALSRWIHSTCSSTGTFRKQILKMRHQIPWVHEKLSSKPCLLICSVSEKPQNKSVKWCHLAREQGRLSDSCGDMSLLWDIKHQSQAGIRLHRFGFELETLTTAPSGNIETISSPRTTHTPSEMPSAREDIGLWEVGGGLSQLHQEAEIGPTTWDVGPITVPLSWHGRPKSFCFIGSPGAVPGLTMTDLEFQVALMSPPHPNHYEAANRTMTVLKGRDSSKESIRDWPRWGWGPGCHTYLVGTPEMGEKQEPVGLILFLSP